MISKSVNVLHKPVSSSSSILGMYLKSYAYSNLLAGFLVRFFFFSICIYSWAQISLFKTTLQQKRIPKHSVVQTHPSRNRQTQTSGWTEKASHSARFTTPIQQEISVLHVRYCPNLKTGFAKYKITQAAVSKSFWPLFITSKNPKLKLIHCVLYVMFHYYYYWHGSCPLFIKILRNFEKTVNLVF